MVSCNNWFYWILVVIRPGFVEINLASLAALGTGSNVWVLFNYYS